MRQIEETGTIRRESGGFVLVRDAGGRYRLELARTPIDLVEKHVRVAGRLIETDTLEVEAIAPA